MDNPSTKEENEMKKIKHYYSSYMQQYEAGNEALLSKSDLLEWYSKTGVKPVSYTHLTLPTICSV